MTQYYAGEKIVVGYQSLNKSGEHGYNVIYADGYESWSPKNPFEEAYVALGNIFDKPPYQQRVIAEAALLDKKISELQSFINGDMYYKTVNEFERARMENQLDAMKAYSSILHERINNF